MSKEALKLALSCIKSSSEYKRGNATFVETAEDIEQALAAPVQPVALKMNGKQLTLGEALDEAIAATERSASKRLNAVLVAAKNALYTTPPAVQPVAMRMPKVGDRVVCIDDESLGTIVYLTAGGSPEIKFDDGSHGTYMLREFAELFGYTTPAAQPATEKSSAVQPEPVQDPVAWEVSATKFAIGRQLFLHKPENLASYIRVRPLIYGDTTPPAQEIVCSTGLCHYKPAAPVQPVASLKEADVLMRAEAHGIDPGTKGLYGFYIDCISSQPAAQRPWVGLTDDEVRKINQEVWGYVSADHTRMRGYAHAIEAKLKEKNT